MKSAGKARNDGLYRHIRTSKEIIRNLLNDSDKYKDSVVGKDSSGGLYDVTLKKIVDKNNKVISASKLKKGSKIYVLYKGGIQESYPMQFQNAYKIKLIA